ncbi:MAG: ABC transporter ATP-binding protein [Clostridia bacterium]|nr:ABC transporter ATP-binding protein [Clostridia bacterium]
MAKKKKSLLGGFVSYYKPYVGAFTFDMFCALLMAVCNLIYPEIARDIIDIHAPNGAWQSVVTLGVIMLGIFLLKAFLNFSVSYWGHLVGMRMQGDMRAQLFAHLEKLPFSYYDETKVGSVMSRLVNDLFEIAELAHHGPENLFISLITIVGALIMILTINPWLSLIVFLVIPIMFVIVISMRKKMLEVFSESREKTSLINAEVESSLSGIRVSKSYTAEKHEIEKFNQTNEQFKKARKNNYLVMSKFHTSMNLCTDLLYLITLVAGGVFFALGIIKSGEMTAYILYISMLVNPIRTFVTLFEQVEEGLSGFKRFREIMEVEPEDFSDGKVKVEKLTGNIQFDHVSFSYVKLDETDKKSADRLIIDDMCLNIQKGNTIALVGPSGGGKTTLCNLIPRFYEIDKGRILIDGIDVRDMSLTDLRKNIGIVQQDVFLYGGTIRENIAYGKLDATEEEIIQASKLANIHDYVMTLPDGYDTYVGERGVKLSGGQKQRVSIARAFLKNPPILILDEATSALDNATEMLIQESLEKLSEGRTTIVVAHRLSTIKNADEIIVITQEGAVERGTHAELLNQNGIYAELYRYQFKSLAE